MIVYDRIEKLVAQLYVNSLLETMKPYEVRNYIKHLTEEEVLNNINHEQYKLDKYYLALFCFSEAFNSCFKGI